MIKYFVLIVLLLSCSDAVSQKTGWDGINTSQTFPSNLAMGTNDITGAGSITADEVYSGGELQRNQTQAWDCRIYMNGSNIVAEDSNGRRIGMANSGYHTFVNAFHANHSVTFIDSNLTLSGSITPSSGTIGNRRELYSRLGYHISMLADVPAIQYNDTWYTSIHDINIKFPNLSTSAAIDFLSRTSTGNYNNYLKRIIIAQDPIGSHHGNFIGIRFYADGDQAYNLQNQVDDVWIYQPNYGIVFTTNDTGVDFAWNNGLSLNNINIGGPYVGVYQYKVAGVGGYLDNRFTNMELMCREWTHAGIVVGSGFWGGTFVDCMNWDFTAPENGANSVIINSGAVNFQWVGGYIGGILADDQVIDSGTNTTITSYGLNQMPFVTHLYDGKLITVIDNGMGDYKSLSNALASITDASATNRYTIIVIGHTDTEKATMKDFVDIVGLNAEVVHDGTGDNRVLYSDYECISTIRNVKFISRGGGDGWPTVDLRSNCRGLSFVGCEISNEDNSHGLYTVGSEINITGCTLRSIAGNAAKFTAGSIINISDSKIIGDTTNIALNIDGSDITAFGNEIISNSALAALDINTDALDNHTLRIDNNRIVAGSGYSINFEASHTGEFLKQNSIIGNTNNVLSIDNTNSGASSILSGQSYKDVAHGLAITPTAQQITITPKEDFHYRWPYVDNINATHFRVNLMNGTATEDLDFGWSIS